MIVLISQSNLGNGMLDVTIEAKMFYIRLNSRLSGNHTYSIIASTTSRSDEESDVEVAKYTTRKQATQVYADIVYAINKGRVSYVLPQNVEGVDSDGRKESV